MYIFYMVIVPRRHSWSSAFSRDVDRYFALQGSVTCPDVT